MLILFVSTTILLAIALIASVFFLKKYYEYKMISQSKVYENNLSIMTNDAQEMEEKLTHIVNGLLAEKSDLVNNFEDLQNRADHLEGQVVELQHRELAIPDISYQNTDINVSKRISEAVAQWQAKVIDLESQLEFQSLEGKNSITSEKVVFEELKQKINALEHKVAEKEKENIAVSLQLNKALQAYEQLNERYKGLEASHVKYEK